MKDSRGDKADKNDETEYPSNEMSSSDDIGSTLVHTRNSMRRLL